MVIAAALFLTFSRLSFALLVPGAIGIALVMFGTAIGYRPAAAIGLLVDLTVAALSTEIVTMAEMDVWQTSILGLLLPTALLAWSALLSEDADSYEMRLRTRHFATAVAIATLFAVAIPVTVFFTSSVLPALGHSLSTMAEISILFVVIAVATLAATWQTDDAASETPGRIP